MTATVAAPPVPATDERSAEQPPGSISAEGSHPRFRRPTVAALVGLMVTIAGISMGLAPLHDNSFLTHLATGRLILDSGSVPRTDPYSFTAAGEPWVVQSWLASLVYGVADHLGGLGGLRILMGVSTGVLGYLVWRLTRPAGSLLGRTVVAVLGIGVGLALWAERPLLFGLVGLGLLLLAADAQIDARWMVPVMWVWVNTHGSFPLAVVLLALLALGRRLDGAPPRTELRVLGWTVAGIAAAAVNPLGPELLLFPVEVLGRTESFRAIVEWQPPKFDDLGPQVFLVQLLVALLLLNRRRSWRAALPMVVFAGLAFSAARNVAPASLVMIPLMAASAVGMGRIDGDRRPRWAMSAAAVLVALGVLLMGSKLRQPDTDLGDYPVASLAWLEDQGMVGPGADTRLVSRDFVGNLLEAQHGRHADVYIDDRVDMYPPGVVEDYVTLVGARPGWQDVLAEAEADAVLWDRDSALGDELLESDRWRVVHEEEDWFVVVPDGVR